MRLAGIAKGGFYPTPERCVQLLAGLLNAGASSDAPAYMSVIRILDPCCGAGNACRELADQMAQRTSVNTRTYGVELEKNRAEKAREQLEFTLSSDIFQTSIANNSFQVLFLNPPYDFDQESKRVEHSFLTHCTKYLEDRGLLVFIIPKHRLGVSAKYLASHYTQLECRRFPDPEYDDFDQVMLLGRRRIRPEHIPRMEKTIREWAISDPGDLQTLEDPPGILPVHAPTGRTGDILFTIRNVNPTRAAEEARRSGLWTWASIQESLWPTVPKDPTPHAPAAGPHGNAHSRRVPRQPLPGDQREEGAGQGENHQDDGTGGVHPRRADLEGPDAHHHQSAEPRHRRGAGREDQGKGQNHAVPQHGGRMKPLLIYVAGPYTGSDRQEIDQNVNRAIDVGIEIFNKGHFPYVPHLTDLVDRRAREVGREMRWEDFMAWDSPWLLVCDALIYIGKSRGADIELDKARRLGKTIFHSTGEIPTPEHQEPDSQHGET